MLVQHLAGGRLLRSRVGWQRIERDGWKPIQIGSRLG